MANKIFTASVIPTNPPVNVTNVIGLQKVGFGVGMKLLFIMNIGNSHVWEYDFPEHREMDYEMLMDMEECCGSGGGGSLVLEELNETFEGLISGTTVTITDYQVGDIVLVHRNGLFKRPDGVDYTRTGATITFTLPFGTSTGGLGDGETISIVSLRQS